VLGYIAGASAFDPDARCIALHGLPARQLRFREQTMGLPPSDGMLARHEDDDEDAVGGAALGGLHPLIGASIAVPLQVLLGRCTEVALVMPEDKEGRFAGREVPLRAVLSVASARGELEREGEDGTGNKVVGDSSVCSDGAWLGEVAALQPWTTTTTTTATASASSTALVADSQRHSESCSPSMLGTVLLATKGLRTGLEMGRS